MALDITARASTPGVRKSTLSDTPAGSGQHVDQREEHEQQQRDDDADEQLLAVAQAERQLGAGLGGVGPHRPAPRRERRPRRLAPPPSAARSAAQGGVGLGGAAGEAEEDVLQALAPGPQVGEGQVVLGQPGGEGGDRGGAWAAAATRYSPGLSSVTAAPRRAPRAATSRPPGAPKRISSPWPLAISSAGRAVGQQVAVVDDDDPVGQLLGLVEVVGGEQHGDARRRAGRRTMRRMSWRPATSMPAVGSSRKATWGRPTRARASDRRCCSPPDSERQVERPAVGQPDPLEQLVGVGRVVVVGWRTGAAPRAAGCRCRRRRPGASRRCARPAAACSASGSRPSTRTVPDGGAAVALEGLDGGGLAGAVGPEQGAVISPGSAVNERPSTATWSP